MSIRQSGGLEGEGGDGMFLAQGRRLDVISCGGRATELAVLQLTLNCQPWANSMHHLTLQSARLCTTLRFNPN